jgi:hypothetical protein
MSRPSRRAVIIAVSSALALTSIAPAALASRSGDDTGNGEESAGLLDLSGLLGSLPVLGPTLSGLGVTDIVDGLGLGSLSGQSLPTVEGIGLPTLEGLGLPGLDGLGLPALDGLGLPALDGLGLPLGVGELSALPLGSPLGLLDILSTPAPGTPAPGLNVLVDLGVTGAVNLL